MPDTYFAFRLAFGICLIVIGCGLILVVAALALSTEGFGYADCCGTVLSVAMIIGGIVLLIPRGRREDWDTREW